MGLLDVVHTMENIRGCIPVAGVGSLVEGVESLVEEWGCHMHLYNPKVLQGMLTQDGGFDLTCRRESWGS